MGKEYVSYVALVEGISYHYPSTIQTARTEIRSIILNNSSWNSERESTWKTSWPLQRGLSWRSSESPCSHPIGEFHPHSLCIFICSSLFLFVGAPRRELFPLFQFRLFFRWLSPSPGCITEMNSLSGCITEMNSLSGSLFLPLFSLTWSSPKGAPSVSQALPSSLKFSPLSIRNSLNSCFFSQTLSFSPLFPSLPCC